jgi:polyribonucleotide nucleotidyltransferase
MDYLESAKARSQAKEAFRTLEKKITQRPHQVEKGIRADGRGPTDIRPIECEVGLLARTHGSALFQRGETQSLVTCTLGTSRDGADHRRPDARIQQEVLCCTTTSRRSASVKRAASWARADARSATARWQSVR